MHKLFVFIRSDLASMTPGKAAAQVAHAASQAASMLRGVGEYREWENSPTAEMNPKSNYGIDAFRGYGTTIVLDGMTQGHLEKLYYTDLSKGLNANYGLIVDPSYPISDGGFTWTVEALTCVWVFGDPDTDKGLEKILRRYELYNGTRSINSINIRSAP